MSENETPVETGAAAEADAPQASWYDSAPDEVKGYIQNKGWDDPIKAVTSYQELEKFRGASEDQLLKLPKEDNPEEWAKIYNRLGRPESPDKYEVALPEDASIDKGRLDIYAKIAHESGITQKQFEALAKADAEYWLQTMQAEQKRIQQEQEAEYEALKKEWGSNHAEREELSRRGLRAVLPKDADKDELLNKIENAIGTAATLKLFANVGERLTREDSIHDTEGDRPTFGYTREQAAADKSSLMSELKADKQRLAAYNRGLGKDYEKMQRINKLLAS